MADIKWIKITTDIFDNKKIRIIESMPEGDSIIVIWFKIIVLAGNINDNGFIYFTKDIPYTEQMIATLFNRPLTTIQMALNTFEKFGMIEIVDDIIHVSNWERYQNVDGMEKIREQTRLRVARCREKKKLECNATSNDTVTQCNDIDIEKDKDKEKEKDKETLDDLVEQNFEMLWKMYPRKDGKHSVSKKAKKEIYKVGKEKMIACIEMFVADMVAQNRDKQYYPQGSTFFNTKYKDYLERLEKEDKNKTRQEFESEDIEQEKELTDEEWLKLMENENNENY